ncbi:MAG TPA: exo-alpha-sialidase [Candidatus Saccharimonadia bacterium]|nr:exo-alpha-sialidase [Candidatus Saccharimonadia bacterium]
MKTLTLLSCLAAALMLQTPCFADEPVKPLEVRTVVADGKHNAFTALRRFKGNLWLAFRSGEAHNSATADVIVLRSKDGKEWTQALKFDVAQDDRDPQLVVTDKRLFLYVPAMDGKELNTWLRYTDDGESWSEPQKIYEPQFILWKPLVHDGTFYAAAHKKDESSNGKGREVHLVKSADGIKWEKVSTIRAGNWESETTMYFDEKHHAVAFLRQKYGSPQAQILESEPPYATWSARPADVNHFSGHSVHTFRGVTYLLSRIMGPGKTTGSMIYTFADGKLTPYCQLPSGGDCAYLEAVEDGPNMLVSFYSTHEGKTNIYLATVPLK